MNKVWIYTITFYNEDDEYGHDVYHATFVELFHSKESADKYKEDFEDPINLKYISGKGKLYDWYYGSSMHRFYSNIEEKEILNY